MKTRKTGFAGLLLAAVLAGCAGIAGGASPAVEKANQEAFRGNHEAAFAILRPLAERGNVEAQYALAKIQLTPRWLLRDPLDGRKWLLKAAEQGHAVAQFDLGYYYAVEEKNYPEALKWFLKVAEERPEETAGRSAAENLGVMYASGQGVARDYAEAARWYRRSAERGGPRGQFALGMFHLEGLGIPKNFDEAVKWLGLAAKQRFEQAQYALIFVFAEGFDTKPSAIEAAYWYTGRRISHEGEAAYHVGTFYSRGFSAWPDEQRVLAWLFRRRGIAADATSRYLKQIYGQRWGDQDEAVRWYRTGAEAGFVGAQVNLARVHWDQEGRYWNCAEAAKWTRLAAEKADPTAMVNLGMLYFQGPRERVVIAMGIEMEDTENGIHVRNVVSGSPAEAAGVRPDDFIVDVNGEDARKLGVQGIVDMVRATKEKEIALRLRRGDEAPRTFGVTPREVRFKCPGADSAGLKRDPEEAVRWFEKASDRGNLTGLFYLAQAYRNGTGVPQDYKKALKLYERGASRGDWEAAQEIAHMYTTGEAGEKNKELADQWFRKAVDLKHKAVRR